MRLLRSVKGDSFVWSGANLEDVDIYINLLNRALMVLNTGIILERLALRSHASTSIFKILITRVIFWDLNEEMNCARLLQEPFTAKICALHSRSSKL